MKALRHKKHGTLYPMNEHLAKHEDIEFVDLDENMNVIEPEEVGPAAEFDPGALDAGEAKASATATTRTRKKTQAEDK